MKISDYLDLAMKKENLRTDNQLRLALNWSPSKVNNYRHNRQAMDNEACRQLAELLNIPVMQIIADMEIYRAKDEPTRKAWKLLAKISSQSGVANPILLIILSFLSVGGVQYILC